MSPSRIFQAFLSIVLGLLGVLLILGCTTDQESLSSATDPSSTAFLAIDGADNNKETVTQATSNVIKATATSTSTEIVTMPVAEQAKPVLILMEDRLTTLDPYYMVSIHPDGSVASHIWDTLTLLNHDLQIEPNLAESWRLVNNFTWEFKLREGITFHNGELLDAEAVRFSIERSRSLPGSVETFARDIDLERVEIIDDYTVYLVTRQPISNLPYHLAFLEILPPAYYSETSSDQVARTPVGSGPYRFGQEEWTSDAPLILEAVTDYWKGTPTYPTLIFETVPLLEERLAALRLQKADLVTDLPAMPVNEWTAPGSSLTAIESTQRLFLGMRIEDGSPLADQDVRQALNYGINIQSIIDKWQAGYGERYASWVNPPWNNPELKPWPYDPELARKLLAEAGYSQGISLTLRSPIDVYDHDLDIARDMAQQLAEIGVNVEVESISNWDVYIRELLAGKTSSLFFLGLNSRGDGLEDVKNLSTTFAFNPTEWRNESYELTLRRAVNTFNESARARLLYELQQIAYEEAPWVWMWRPHDFYGVSQRLDWNPRRDGLINLYKPTPEPNGNDP